MLWLARPDYKGIRVASTVAQIPFRFTMPTRLLLFCYAFVFLTYDRSKVVLIQKDCQLFNSCCSVFARNLHIAAQNQIPS